MLVLKFTGRYEAYFVLFLVTVLNSEMQMIETWVVPSRDSDTVT